MTHLVRNARTYSLPSLPSLPAVRAAAVGLPWCDNSTIEGANSTTSDTAGEWTVVPPRGGRNRFRSPVPGTETAGDTAVSTVLSWRLNADRWPGGLKLTRQRTTSNQQLGIGDGELSSGRKR